MLQEEPYFPSFKKSRLYIKLLAELDLLRDPSLKEGDPNGMLEEGESSCMYLCGSLNHVLLFTTIKLKMQNNRK